MKKSHYFIFLGLVLALSILFTVTFGNNNEVDPLGYALNSNNTIKEPIIFIHDVSPKYFNELKDIEKIIDKYNYQDRTYLFIIVNHANEYNLKNYPKFVEYLHHLESKGYHIEYHGYNHIGEEFNCNKSVAEEKLNNSL
ncbi:DUF2334 domain-containing protein [Methanocaldococcus infernus]